MLSMPRSALRLSSGAPAAEAAGRFGTTLPKPAELFSRAAGQTRLALAVSGGSDSMAMLCLAHQWVQEGFAPAFCVLTVDHGLRAGSAEEALQVAHWCVEMGFQHHILHWEGAKPATGIQAAARAARYDLMSSWCRRHGVDMLMTAHTLDDQAETVAMRLRRTATDASLAGIWVERPWNGIRLFRPLLGIRRAALRHYLDNRRQGWIDDPSNEQERFERVRVRRDLAQSGADEISALGQRAEDAAENVRTATERAQSYIAEHLTWHAAGYGELERQAFAQLDGNVQSAVLSLAMVRLTAAQASPASLFRLSRWIVGGGAPRRSLGGLLFGLRTRTVIFCREPGRISPQPVAVPASGQLLWDHRFEVMARPGARVVPAISLAQVAGPQDAPRLVREGWPVVLDSEGGIIPAEVRFSPYLR